MGLWHCPRRGGETAVGEESEGEVVPNTKYDTTVARIAGNLLSNVDWQNQNTVMTQESYAEMAVAMAVAIVKAVRARRDELAEIIE